MSKTQSGAKADAPPSREAVVSAVAAIVESRVLGKSKRRADLLQYIVGQELAGDGEKLKAFTIATDVFGRGASFEASTDSIVRSEIGRLRDALKLFYAERAHEGFVHIAIPKGTYRPEFSSPLTPAPPHKTYPFGLVGAVAVLGVAALVFFWTWADRQTQDASTPVSISELPFEAIRISVTPFVGLGENAAVDELAFGMSSEVMMDLSVYPWISVVSSRVDAPSTAPQSADYVLTGSTFWDDTTLTTHAELVAQPDNNVIWSDNLTVSVAPGTIRQSVIDVSVKIAAILGSIHGIAPQLAKSRSAQVSAEGLEALLCYLGLHKYLQQPTDAAHLALRTCLSDTVEAFPNYGDAWAALALLQMDESRFNRNPRTNTDPWADAARSIEQALIYAPTRMPSLNAAIIHAMEGPQKDLEAFERYAALLLKLYPRHPPSLFNVGSRMAEFGGEWDKGLALVDQALLLDANPPTFFHITQAYRQALSGSDKDAWFSAQKLTTQTSKSEVLLNFLAASRNGFIDDAVRNLELLQAEGLSTKDQIGDHIRSRRYSDALEAALLEQLEAAFSSTPLLE
ncbi:MAG: hypothetical protein AB8B58_15510 [Roseobacter sp.]